MNSAIEGVSDIRDKLQISASNNETCELTDHEVQRYARAIQAQEQFLEHIRQR